MHRAETKKGKALFMTNASDDIAAPSPCETASPGTCAAPGVIISCRCDHRRSKTDYYKVQWCFREETKRICLT